VIRKGSGEPGPLVAHNQTPEWQPLPRDDNDNDQGCSGDDERVKKGSGEPGTVVVHNHLT